jgi:hypothetical protein
MSVKSDRPMRPGSWVWRKITSCSGPCSARQARIRRAGTEIGVAAQEFLEDRDRPDTRRRLQQRNHLRLENLAERVRAASVPQGLLLRR